MLVFYLTLLYFYSKIESMKNIREIVSANLLALRKQRGLTQMELAKKVNYSDKAISRWEKGEVLPDLETLQTIAKEFNVPLSYLIEENMEQKVEGKIKPTKNEILLHMLTICVGWTILTILFVYMQIIYDYTYWQAFVWGIPVTTIITMRFCKKWADFKLKLTLRTILNWSLLASIYVQLLSYNLFLIFIIGVPIQASIIVASLAKPKPRNKIIL